jgi:hypothetical protein
MPVQNIIPKGHITHRAHDSKKFNEIKTSGGKQNGKKLQS